MTDMNVVVLQNYMDLEKAALGLCRKTCPTFSQDADQATNTKLEQVSVAEEKEDPVRITFPGIKAELKVSCIKRIVRVSETDIAAAKIVHFFSLSLFSNHYFDNT
jgi:hypothetical protein